MKRKGKRAKSNKQAVVEVVAQEPKGIKTKDVEIEWFTNKTTFGFDYEDVRFHGWWRKIKVDLFAIDIYAKKEVEGGTFREFAIEGLHYREDPRSNMDKLDSDIIARCSWWFRVKLNGQAELIDELIRKATQPTVVIRKVQSIDKILFTLREFRDTAIRCGGRRYFEIAGDAEKPTMLLDVDLSSLKGNVPALIAPAAPPRPGQPPQKKSAESKPRAASAPVEGDVAELLQKLKAAKSNGDQAAQRKIRAALRAKGHKGGIKAVGSVPEVKHEKPKETPIIDGKRKGKRAKKG